jgi:hypothetical protein
MLEQLGKRGHQGHQVLHPVLPRDEHDDCERQRREVLLELETPVGRDEDVERRRGECQQLPVPDAGPSLCLNRGNFVARDQAARSRGSDSSSRMRIGDNRRAGALEQRDGLRPRHRGELAQELVERVPFFQIVEQRPDRDPSSREHRSAALDLGIDHDQRVVHGERLRP